MKYTITGDNLQFVNVSLSPDDEFHSTAGSMAYMTGNMTMEAEMKGGLWAGIKRSFSGASLFLVRYTPHGGVGIVGLGGNAPGKIYDIDVAEGNWICQNSAYLGSEGGVKLDLAFQKKFGSMMFGGEGVILQKLSGEGMAFIAACGDLVVVDLKEGEQYKVATSNAVAWEETVTYDITAAGGIKTALFGGEGIFVTTLTGPGKIIIQSMTLAQLAGALIPYLPTNTGSS